jgi:hypothetical protein
MSHAFRRAWLKCTAVVIGSAGPILFFGAMPATSGVARWMLDLLSWPVDGNMDYAAAATRFLSALSGGFLMGWGVTVWLLSVYVYDAAPEGVRRSVVYGLLAWFVFDSTGSIVSGNAWNAAFNVPVLLLAVGPLWRPAEDSDATGA